MMLVRAENLIRHKGDNGILHNLLHEARAAAGVYRTCEVVAPNVAAGGTESLK